MSRISRMRHGMLMLSALTTAAAMPASAFEMKAGEVSVELYGYARLNASYDLDENAASPFGTRAGSFAAVNRGDAEEDEVTGHFGADAVQSRLGLVVEHPSGVAVTLEGDFRPGDFRLRHAYGEYNHIIAGQTWSNFNSFVGYTSTVDFDSLAGLAGIQDRTAQLRYTVDAFSVSLEEPLGSTFDDDPTSSDPTADLGDASKASIPTLTARYESGVGPLSYSVAGLVQEIALDNGREDEREAGFATFVAAEYQVTDAISLQAVGNYSNGGNTYLYRSGEDFGAPDAYYTGDSLERIQGYGGTVGATLDLGKSSFNVGYGFATVDWDDARDDLGEAAVADQHETNSNIIANYQWTPVENVLYGIEYQHLMVEEVDGDDGSADRLLFAAQYDF